MNGATLFSGIGAPEQAMHRWHWPWHAEIEKFPSAVMAKRHPRSVNLGDVTADDFCDRAQAIATPDVLIFGSPCQSFSVAGKRLGMDDPRGNLALVALGIVGRLEPRWFILENVPGLLSSADGRDFGLFLRTVDELGYSLAWTVLDAQHFGVAQRRERVFAVGYLGDWRGPAAVLFEPEGLCGHSPPRREAGQRVAHSLAPGAGGGSGHQYRQNGSEDQVVAFNNTGQGWWNEDHVAAGMRDASAGGASHSTVVAHALRAEGFDASEDGTGRGTPLIADTVRSHPRPGSNSVGLLTFDTTQITSKTNRCQPSDGDPCHPLAAAAHAPAIAFNWQGGGDQTSLGYNPDAQITGVLQADQIPAIAGAAVRRLTPRECERLQGYSDDYTLIEYRGKPAADGPRYKALGNSMAVPVMRWILSRIEKVDAASAC